MMSLADTKNKIIESVLNHPSEPSPQQVADSSNKEVEKLTKQDWWNYYAKLENWTPLAVRPTSSSDWFQVASSSVIGVWHHTNPSTGACDCEYGTRKASCPGLPECKHPEAVRSHLERASFAVPVVHIESKLMQSDREIVEAAVGGAGFKAIPLRETFLIQDGHSKQTYGYIYFCDEQRNWCLVESGQEDKEPIRLESASEAVGMLAAIASFGWQRTA